MSSCKICGGAIFASGDVVGYGGPICSGHHGQGNDMEQAKPKSQDKVTSEPPKHSCTAEIIAELERLKGIDCFNEAYTTDPRPARHIDIRLKELKGKAKETQL